MDSQTPAKNTYRFGLFEADVVSREARLVLSEAEVNSGSSTASNHVSVLTSDACSHDLELIAAKAAKLQERR